MEIKIETEIKEEFLENEVFEIEDLHHSITIKDELPSESLTSDNENWNNENELMVEIEDNFDYDLHQRSHETKTCVNLGNLSHSMNTGSGERVNKKRNPNIETNMKKQETDNKQAYSCKEKVILTSIVEKYKIIIENKKTNTEDNKKKKEAWLLIEANYNSHPDVDCKRTAQQLKKCWENLKQRRRKNRTDESKSYLATSSEPPLKIPKPDPKLTEVVSSTAPVSDLDIDSSTDSTAVYQQKDVLCTSTEKHEEAAKLTYEATPTPSFSHVEVFLDLEKTLRIQKLNESIEHQKVLQNLQVEAAIAELNAKKYEEEYWKKKLESL